MAGTTRFGTGPASVLHPSAVDGTQYLRGDGPPEYRLNGAWVGMPLGPAGGPELVEDFLGASGTTLPAPLATQDTSAAGAPTLDYADDAAGGAFILKLAADNELEKITLYQGDQLTFDVTKGLVAEFRIKLEPDVTGAGGELATGDVIVFGLASARDATLDDVVTHAWFRLEGDGSNKNILVETDDGTTDTDDQDTTIDWVANTYQTFAIDASDLGNVRFFVDGVLANPAKMAISAATGNLQVFVEVQKAAAANNDHRLTIDYLRARATSR